MLSRWIEKLRADKDEPNCALCLWTQDIMIAHKGFEIPGYLCMAQGGARATEVYCTAECRNLYKKGARTKCSK